jgi:hypothetical protein
MMPSPKAKHPKIMKQARSTANNLFERSNITMRNSRFGGKDSASVVPNFGTTPIYRSGRGIRCRNCLKWNAAVPF